MEDEGILDILDGTADPRHKARLLFTLLEKRRYPLLASWKARFAAARSRLGVQEGDIQVSHDPTFETTLVRVQILAASEPEFKQRLETLSEAAREGRIEGLFQALCVNAEVPSKKRQDP
jgi:hypothetical protein